MTVSSRVYDLLFERKLHLLNKPSALCKLSFALVNDKLQEAEEDNEELREAGAMTIIYMMTDDCPLEMIYDSLLGAEPFLLDDSQIETARRRSRRAEISRA